MRLRAAAVLASLTLAPGPLLAQMNCQLDIVPFDFGLYVPADPSPLDITGSLDVSCRGQTGFFVATLSPGTSGTFAERQMLSGPYLMGYNLFIDTGRTIVWGDGTGGSWPNGRAKLRRGREDFSIPIYGRVFPEQSVGAGLYVDDVIVTVIF